MPVEGTCSHVQNANTNGDIGEVTRKGYGQVILEILIWSMSTWSLKVSAMTTRKKGIFCEHSLYIFYKKTVAATCRSLGLNNKC